VLRNIQEHWEQIGNMMGNHQELDEIILRMRENEKNLSPSTPTQKESNWDTLSACRAYHWLHAIYLPS